MHPFMGLGGGETLYAPLYGFRGGGIVCTPLRIFVLGIGQQMFQWENHRPLRHTATHVHRTGHKYQGLGGVTRTLG